MSGTTSVPTIQFTATGFVAPDETAIVTGLNADYAAAFNGNLNTDPSTPQGQLITSTAAMLGDTYDQEALLFNSVDPAYAFGRMQDAIARIYFLERNPAQSTVLDINCIGAVGVVIPVGASLQDPAGNLYLCNEAGIIPSSGTVTLTFASAILAPIPVPLTVSIYQTIPQWNAATVAGGVVGNLAESRAAFETRREASVAANGAGFLPAISGAISKVPGVIDWYATENDTASPATIGGVTVAANSLYVAVSGGAAADVAQAIWTKKNPGCAYNGSTTYSIYDTNSGYSPPYPGPYVVSWVTPIGVATSFSVTLKTSAQIPSTALAQIQAAIMAAFLGQDGGTRARIGSEIFASRYYAGVAMLGSWAQIISIQIGNTANQAASFTGVLVAGALTVSGVTGTIAIGQFLYGAGVMSGSVITSGSGTSWVVAGGQTLSSEAMETVAANNNDLTLNINQVPTLASADITLTLV
jgi:baseplate J-like protein